MDQKLDKNSIFETLKSHKMELKGFGVKRIGLFGSYFNNQVNPDSDIDFLVELQKEKKTYRNFMALSYFLEHLFQKNIDLITPQSLSPYIGPHILNSVEYVSFTK
ncbi:nucleotidyltransferase family protein [Cyclobacterium salsum]|uniref:nucleotidyltransferase family protein n=1 Tax=Cyclobacterium salsum TaxID=2666329 RepID=UPI001391BB24|nr:nucleotidyltransferase family protein [Cyclobacterium salsum]